jgi:hypothetical protein
MGDFPDDHGAHAHLGALISEFVRGDRVPPGIPHGIPLPGHGQTLARWQLFATIAARRGAVAIKLFEAHADALAILAEVAGATPAPDSSWAIWAAEPPDARLRVQTDDSPSIPHIAGLTGNDSGTDSGTDTFTPARLTGRKAWCSGAWEVSHALVTCWLDQAEPGPQRLAIVDMAGPGVTVTREGWHAVGMAATDSGDVLFDDCPALLLTAPDAYLRRPGFWHGGAGIAACWHGAALPLAHAVRAALKKRDDPHAAAHLAAIDGDLHASAALLRETAQWIDAHPTEDAFVPAMRARTVIEAAVLRVIQHAGNTLGAGPLCRNPTLAALYADLPVLLRQSHAERDLAALGQRLAQDDSDMGAL